MSFRTWSKLYYPTEADTTKKGLPAIDHSLRKWEGLTKAKLKKYGMVHDDRWVTERATSDDDGGWGDGLCIDEQSCALCVHYFDDWGTLAPCAACPLYKVRGVACDVPIGNQSSSPYLTWRDHGNAQPMINLIKKARVAFEMEADRNRRVPKKKVARK